MDKKCGKTGENQEKFTLKMKTLGNFLTFRNRPWNRPKKGFWLLNKIEKRTGEGSWPWKRNRGRNLWRILTLTQSKKTDQDLFGVIEELYLHMTGFVLNMAGFILNMTGFLLDVSLFWLEFVLNLSGWVIHMTLFVLYMTGFSNSTRGVKQGLICLVQLFCTTVA